MNKREVLEKLLNIPNPYIDINTGKDCEEGVTCMMCGFPLSEIDRKKMVDTALAALNKLEKEKMNGAYKSGYHDALNGRPFKV